MYLPVCYRAIGSYRTFSSAYTESCYILSPLCPPSTGTYIYSYRTLKLNYEARKCVKKKDIGVAPVARTGGSESVETNTDLICQ